jgi:hypothetical protein
MVEIARMYNIREEDQQTKAKEIYRKVLDDYPESLAVHEAALRLAHIYFFNPERDSSEKGVAVLEEHLAKYPENPLASIMHFRLVHWYEQAFRDYENGLRHAFALSKYKMADPWRWATMYWNIAQTLRVRFGKEEESLKWYKKILTDTSRDAMGLVTKQVIAEIEGKTVEQVEQEIEEMIAERKQQEGQNPGKGGDRE